MSVRVCSGGMAGTPVRRRTGNGENARSGQDPGRVDGAVLEVILRKAAKIREELGVAVPLPDDGHTLSQALLKAVLLRRSQRDAKRQTVLAFMEMDEAKAIETKWRDAADRAKRG